MNEPSIDPTISKFLDLLKALREKKGLTREQLALKAGVHKTTIGLLERKKRIPTMQIANQIAKALDTKLSALVKEAEKEF